MDSERCQSRSVAERSGPGLGTQHLHTKFLWTRERVKERDAICNQGSRTERLVDEAMKPVARLLEKYCKAVCVMVTSTR